MTPCLAPPGTMFGIHSLLLGSMSEKKTVLNIAGRHLEGLEEGIDPDVVANSGGTADRGS